MHHLYVPNLINKAAEVTAFRGLASDAEEVTEPCFIVPTVDTSNLRWFISQQIEFLRRTLLDTNIIRTAKRFYLDVSAFDEIPSTEHLGVSFVSTILAARFLPIPTFSINASDSFFSEFSRKLNARTDGICLRIRLKDFENLALKLDAILAVLNTYPCDCDLLIDFGLLNWRSPTYVSKLYDIPKLEEWRSIIFCGGSMPNDLSSFSFGKNATARWESINYLELVHADFPIRQNFKFADFVTRPAQYNLLSTGGIPSPSVRHTISEGIEVFRGQKTKNDTRLEQYSSHINRLVSSANFKGKDFSWGDEFFHKFASGQDMSLDIRRWIAAELNHHITFVARDLRDQAGRLQVAAQ